MLRDIDKLQTHALHPGTRTKEKTGESPLHPEYVFFRCFMAVFSFFVPDFLLFFTCLDQTNTFPLCRTSHCDKLPSLADRSESGTRRSCCLWCLFSDVITSPHNVHVVDVTHSGWICYLIKFKMFPNDSVLWFLHVTVYCLLLRCSV